MYGFETLSSLHCCTTMSAIHLFRNSKLLFFQTEILPVWTNHSTTFIWSQLVSTLLLVSEFTCPKLLMQVRFCRNLSVCVLLGSSRLPRCLQSPPALAVVRILGWLCTPHVARSALGFLPSVTTGRDAALTGCTWCLKTVHWALLLIYPKVRSRAIAIVF